MPKNKTKVKMVLIGGEQFLTTNRQDATEQHMPEQGGCFYSQHVEI